MPRSDMKTIRFTTIRYTRLPVQQQIRRQRD